MFGTKISNYYTFGQAMGAKHMYMVARVNKELCLTKAIHFVKVLCREFVHGNLFSLGLPAALTPFCKCKSKRWSRTCSIRKIPVLETRIHVQT